MSEQRFETLATTEVVKKTEAALTANGFSAEYVENGESALVRIKALIPAGASVMNGSSVTLEQIGFVDYLQDGKHGWNNMHESILAEKDKAKQMELRKLSVLSDFYLGSAHAITEDGQIMISSNSGSQLPHLVFTSQNVILVVSTKKIVAGLADANERIEKHIVPLEDEHMKQKYGSGTKRNKTVILHGENPMMGRTVHIIFINENLGF